MKRRLQVVNEYSKQRNQGFVAFKVENEDTTLICFTLSSILLTRTLSHAFLIGLRANIAAFSSTLGNACDSVRVILSRQPDFMALTTPITAARHTAGHAINTISSYETSVRCYAYDHRMTATKRLLVAVFSCPMNPSMTFAL